MVTREITRGNAMQHGLKMKIWNARKKTAQNLTKVLGPEQIEDISTLLSEVSYYIERNANPKVLFLDTSIQLHEIIRNKRAVGA